MGAPCPSPASTCQACPAAEIMQVQLGNFHQQSRNRKSRLGVLGPGASRVERGVPPTPVWGLASGTVGPAVEQATPEAAISSLHISLQVWGQQGQCLANRLTLIMASSAVT